MDFLTRKGKPTQPTAKEALEREGSAADTARGARPFKRTALGALAVIMIVGSASCSQQQAQPTDAPSATPSQATEQTREEKLQAAADAYYKDLAEVLDVASVTNEALGNYGFEFVSLAFALDGTDVTIRVNSIVNYLTATDGTLVNDPDIVTQTFGFDEDIYEMTNQLIEVSDRFNAEKIDDILEFLVDNSDKLSISDGNYYTDISDIDSLQNYCDLYVDQAVLDEHSSAFGTAEAATDNNGSENAPAD